MVQNKQPHSSRALDPRFTWPDCTDTAATGSTTELDDGCRWRSARAPKKLTERL